MQKIGEASVLKERDLLVLTFANMESNALYVNGFSSGKPLERYSNKKDGGKDSLLANHSCYAQQIESIKVSAALKIIRAAHGA